jgi:Flp pilus assembly secretin CpaC
MFKKLSISIFFLMLFLSSNLFAIPMVEVSVDIIEIKRTLTNNQGVSWNDAIKFEEGLSQASYLNFAQPSVRAVAPEAFRIGNITRVDPLIATLRLMINDNTARILANPKLSTESGSQASFLVGGEIPVPVTSPQGVSIEWKTYGINLQIRPNIMAKEKQISAMIQISISDLDYANSVKLNGYDVPALLNRSANSKVTVDDGGTVVIAGLKQARKESTQAKVPFLSSIPLLGWFFKSNSDKDMDTSMVVFVTFKSIENGSKSI